MKEEPPSLLSLSTHVDDWAGLCERFGQGVLNQGRGSAAVAKIVGGRRQMVHWREAFIELLILLCLKYYSIYSMILILILAVTLSA